MREMTVLPGSFARAQRTDYRFRAAGVTQEAVLAADISPEANMCCPAHF